MLNALSGYKTYITCLAGLLTNLAMYLNGQETLSTAINAGIGLLAAVFIRSGVTAEASK